MADNPGVKCPGCKKMNDGVTGLTCPPESRPNPGNVSVCVYCGCIAIFQEDLSLRIATNAEIEEVEIDIPHIREMARAIHLEYSRITIGRN